MYDHTACRDLLMDAAEYVTGYLKQWLPSNRYFHGLLHTQQVVAACEELAAYYDLPWQDTEALILAAWFHDVGYCDGSLHHEERSVAIMTEFLEDYAMGFSFTFDVAELILATRIHHQASNLREMILRDSDFYHLSSPEYLIWSQMLKQEAEFAEGHMFSEAEWNLKNIEFFEKHSYLTDFAVSRWDERKNINLHSLVRLSALHELNKR